MAARSSRLGSPVSVLSAVLAVAITSVARGSDEFWAAPSYLPSTLYRVQWTTGNATAIALIPNIEPTDLAMSSGGTLYASTIDELYRIDTTTAAATFVGTVSTFSGLVGLDFAPNGTLYAVNYTGGVLTIDPGTAASGTLFTLPVNFGGDVAALDANTLYACIEGGVGGHLIRIDVGAQSHTWLGAIAPGYDFWALDFDGAGNLIAVATSGDVFHIQSYSTSGTGTWIGTTNQGALGGLASVDGACPTIGAYCTAGFTSSFCQAMITASGTPSASAPNGFAITVVGTEPQKQGMLFYGIDNSSFTPLPWGTGSSYLCVKSPVQRMGVQFTGGTLGQCDGVLSIDWNSFRAANPLALGAPFVPGQHVYAQGWFRDPPSPKTTSLSNGLTFVTCP